MQQHPMHLGGRRCALPPNPPPAFLFLRMTPLTATPLPRTARRNKKTKKEETHGTARKKRTKVKKTSEFTGKSSKMKGKYQKKKENTWETQKTKKIPKKNKKNSKINLAPFYSINSITAPEFHPFPVTTGWSTIIWSRKIVRHLGTTSWLVTLFWRACLTIVFEKYVNAASAFFYFCLDVVFWFHFYAEQKPENLRQQKELFRLGVAKISTIRDSLDIQTPPEVRYLDPQKTDLDHLWMSKDLKSRLENKWYLEPQTTIYRWMFGETTIFYIKI